MPRKLVRSLKYARAGAEHALRTQRNIWIHIFIAIVVLALAFWLRVTLIELVILVLTISFVITTEIINTAIEELVNILSPEHRVEAALAKNVAAAAVLIAVIGSVILGLLIFAPKLMRVIGIAFFLPR